MHILVDLRALQSGNIAGVEVFTENLVRHLCEMFPKTRFYLWTNSQEDLPENFPMFVFPNAIRVHTRISNRKLALTAAFFRKPKIDLLLREKLQEEGIFSAEGYFDAALIPDPRPTPLSSRCRKIMIFHDLSAFHFASSFSRKTRFWHRIIRLKKEACESDRILTPSLFTKEDIVSQFNIPAEKVTVIGAGVSELFHPLSDPIELAEVRKKYKLPLDFFLTLSTLEPRKNLRNLIEGFLRFQKKTQSNECALVIAGKANPEIFAELKLPESPSIIFPGFIAEADKAALFSAATAFVYPSLFEGFGLPVLEALACGTPVLSSNVASLPEVYGDAALTFDPTQVSEITEALETVYMRRDLRTELSKKGRERAQNRQFSWDTVAEKVMAVLEEGEN